MDTYDLSNADVRDLNQALHESAIEAKQIQVTNPGGKHNIAVGAMHECDVNIKGHVGCYCAGMNQGLRFRRSRHSPPGSCQHSNNPHAP